MSETSKYLAAIDLGTNSFHLIVVKISNDGSFEIVDSEREVIRLGEGSAGDIKFIKPEACERAISTLKKFGGIAESYDAKLRAVATSAVREAHNKNDFIRRVHEETGIDIEIISGQEEARLIYLGILKAVPIFNKKALIIDIGGGSTEFLLGYKGGASYTISVKIGAVRLTEKFFPDSFVTEGRIKECRKWIEGEICQIADHVKQEGYNICVGSSGTIMSAGLMIQAIRKNNSSLAILNNFDFTKKELDKIVETILSKKRVEKREKIKGLDEKRADIIPAGIIILQTIFDLLKLNRMTISGYALREGIIIDTFQKQNLNALIPEFIDIRRQSVKHLAESCRYNVDHCEYVSKLSLQLFDDLYPLHQLDDKYKEYLEAAAILHDIGYHISHTNHHHHSYYIIKNSELLGFTENEIDIIAHTARYHRKSHPKTNHSEFNELPVQTQEIIKKLSAILRVADSFDRTHKKLVRSIRAKILNGAVKLTLECKNKTVPEIEIWNFQRRKGLFEEVFEKRISAICHT